MAGYHQGGVWEVEAEAIVILSPLSPSSPMLPNPLQPDLPRHHVLSAVQYAVPGLWNPTGRRCCSLTVPTSPLRIFQVALEGT